jgi:hypothetical protein
MSQQTIARISNVLDRQFEGLINMSDWEGRPEVDRKKAFLSRAVAALCIKNLAQVEIDVAAKAVTDGFDDNGLDAIFFDQKNDALLLVQSKWSADGTKPINADGTGAMAAGVRDLFAARFERFNDKIKAKKAEVMAALYSLSDRLGFR